MQPCLSLTAKFQDLFIPCQGYFSTFHHCTRYTIGLKMCLGLEVNISHIQLQYSMEPTQEMPTAISITPTGLSPSLALLSSKLWILERGKKASHNTTSLLPFGNSFGLPCTAFNLLYSRHLG